LLVLGSVGSANGDIEERHEKSGGRDIIKREKIATTRAKYDKQRKGVACKYLPEYYSTGGRSVYIYVSTSCISSCRKIVETKQSHKSGHNLIKSQGTIPQPQKIYALLNNFMYFRSLRESWQRRKRIWRR
jgi:hypothetical protein